MKRYKLSKIEILFKRTGIVLCLIALALCSYAIVSPKFKHTGTHYDLRVSGGYNRGMVGIVKVREQYHFGVG